MSIRAIAWALTIKTGSPSAKLVLIKLADNANDEGRCWPSVAHIVDHTEMSERAVRQHIKSLESSGILTIEKRIVEGSQLPNVYVLNLQQTVGGVHQMQGGGAGDAPAPGAGDAPQVNRQDSKPPIKPPQPSASLFDELPNWIPKEPWAAFVEMRKRSRKPLTGRAIKLAIGELEKLRLASGDVGEIIDQTVLHGWQTFYPLKNGSNSNGTGHILQSGDGRPYPNSPPTKILSILDSPKKEKPYVDR